MKLFLKFILILFFVPCFIFLVLGITIKYKLLTVSFWEESFTNHNTYVELSKQIKVLAETKTIQSGGNKNDIRVLTDIASPENVRDFVDKNIINLLSFVNGKQNEVLVYLPLSKLPGNLSPKSIGLSKDEIPLTALLTKFNISQDTIPITQIALLGKSANYFLSIVLALILVILTLIILVSWNDSGPKVLGIALSISGAFLILISRFGNLTRLNIQNHLQSNISQNSEFIKILFSGVFEDIFKYWVIFGYFTLVFGIILIILRKKPVNN